MYNGLLDLPWWGYVGVTLALTHITIAAVTIYLHRCQTHLALDLHWLPSHFFRFWLWLTTGMVTKEWVATHRWHHAKVETPDDPHSPQVYGINRVLWGGVLLYVKASHNHAAMERYGKGTPDDRLERHIYTPLQKWGVVLMLVIDFLLFGIVPGALIWIVQMLWIPFWAAGVINGIGHYWGYRSFQPDQPEDASRNIVPWGILIGGEELHNNHHAFPTSAQLSNKWWEFDIGWMYIRILQFLGLAHVKKAMPKVVFDEKKTRCDLETLQTVLSLRMWLLAEYDRLTRKADVEPCVVQSFRESLRELWSQNHRKDLPEQQLAYLQAWREGATRCGTQAVEEFAWALTGYRVKRG